MKILKCLPKKHNRVTICLEDLDRKVVLRKAISETSSKVILEFSLYDVMTNLSLEECEIFSDTLLSLFDKLSAT